MYNSISDFEPDPGGHEAGERRPQGEAGEVRGRLTSRKKLQGVTWSHLPTGHRWVSSRWCRSFQVPHYVKKFSVIITHWDTQTLNMVTIRIGHATHVTVKYIRTMVR